ncbi:MAG: PSD1 and planctomycete cytochrome C domain-containing protein [Planctomycetota bacterium]|nr:PSD1 and planctomycete cytochrome C domain-containing protein [Planctomycetota bacterium]
MAFSLWGNDLDSLRSGLQIGIRRVAKPSLLLLPAICWLSSVWISLSCFAVQPIDFNRDIRPILSDNCFACHGFDAASRATSLRLDTIEGATEDLGGYAALVPGNPKASEMLARILSTDEEVRMPPAESHKKPLNAKAVSLIRQWIEEGAEWGKHWAFKAPVAAALPATATHPVDHFVEAALHERNMKLSPPALPHTLARRLAFDLTGLPPSSKEVAALTESPGSAAWSRWIDQLLASPHFGERMAMWWLDGARYADTDGFQSDATRQNWPWRDWVVSSFNANRPFDEFTIEQFAGDLLPEATAEQRLATCFHRNHMHNGEGGRDPAESRVDYVLDRTNTMGTLWLGLTLGCTQCHDHKFDPISQRDYYSLTAYFNSIDEDGKAGGGAKPFLQYRSPLAKQAVLESAAVLRKMERQVEAAKEDAESAFIASLDKMLVEAHTTFQPWKVIQPASLRTTEGTVLAVDTEGMIRSNDSGQYQDDFVVEVPTDTIDRISGIRLEVFADEQHADAKYSYAASGEFILTNVKLQLRSRKTATIVDVPLVRATASVQGKGVDTKYGSASGTLDDDPRTGWTTRTKPVEPVQVVIFELAEPIELSQDSVLDIVLMQRSLAPRELIGRFRLSATNQRGRAVRSLDPMPMEQLAKRITDYEAETKNEFSADDIPADLRSRLFDQYLADDPSWQEASRLREKASRQVNTAKNAAGDLRVTVLSERSEPRKTHVLVRGVWNQHGDEVQPSVLTAVLPRSAVFSDPGVSQDVAGGIGSRLELAKWIVSKRNPLTARVITNHVWQLFFGAGLVRTPNDFGLQGEMPTHPELLDWLAVDFMDHDWDFKHLVRRIVTSRTYQQSSDVTPALLEIDPENRLLARGARFRLPSWMIRDASLAAAGLLNRTVGGPPIFAYQPPGVWQDQFMGRFKYESTLGPGQYRRTLYTFWRRSSAPTFLFDSAMRRTCEVVPRRTNTPLHALTLLNDLTALEAARSLAERTLMDSSSTDVERKLSQMFHAVLSRFPSDHERQVLVREYRQAKDYYQTNVAAAKKLTSVGQLPEPNESTISELAAKMMMASMILNLDEAISHE